MANTMVITVLERRSEMGLRRALGATRGHIRRQFIVESALLASLGGLAGDGVGSVLTGAYAAHKGWPPAIPPAVLVAALSATVALGVIAGLYPAWRAGKVPPTQALARSS